MPLIFTCLLCSRAPFHFSSNEHVSKCNLRALYLTIDVVDFCLLEMHACYIHVSKSNLRVLYLTIGTVIFTCSICANASFHSRCKNHVSKSNLRTLYWTIDAVDLCVFNMCKRMRVSCLFSMFLDLYLHTCCIDTFRGLSEESWIYFP